MKNSGGGVDQQELEKRLKKRILAFYFAGAVNLLLGLYVLVAGGAHLGQGSTMLIALFFLGFAAVDFYFPRSMKKRWLEEQARMRGSPPPDGTP
jgi:pilus assembly protein TadC